MSENSKIEWTDHTFNPWIGCTKVGPGCDHCYAENLMDKRMGVAVWGPGNERVRTKEANWKMPLRWNAQADAFMALHGRRQRVFCASLADVFDNAVHPQWRADLFELIEQTPNLDWLLLTKRVGNVVPMSMNANWPMPMPRNIWLGASIVNREEMLRDGPKLKQVPARVHFWSCEPLLGDLGEIPHELMPHWIIAGGESGPGARPMHPNWARGLRDQCEAAGVPFLFKQWGEWMPTIHEGDTVKLVFEKGAPHGPDQPAFHDWPDGQGAARVGKKAAGRLLDGRTWDGFPS